MLCEKCKAPYYKNVLIPVHPWVAPLRYAIIINLIICLGLALGDQYFSFKISLYFLFIPLALVILIISLYQFIMVFAQADKCKNCGHINLRRQEVELTPPCVSCMGKTFSIIWSYPKWVKFLSELVLFFAAVAFIFFVITIFTPARLWIYLCMITAWIWLVLFLIFDSRERYYKRYLLQGTGTKKQIRCAHCQKLRI